MNEDDLPLSEYVKLPGTVDFQVLNTDRFRAFAAQRKYLHVGTELANNYVVVYTDKKYVEGVLAELGGDFLSFFPKIMSPVDSRANTAAGITPVLNQPFLGLTGRGVVIGIIDTGIDFTKRAFTTEDGRTRILAIWDQTTDGPRPDPMYYGAVYTESDINEALDAPDPFKVVPTSDEDGHGTFLASVAAGSGIGDPEGEIPPDTAYGAAPGASIIAVKLRRARDYYIERYLLSLDDPDLYESTDFLLGVKFVLDEARKRNMPAVICVGMGSNFSAHDGNSLFEDYVSFVSERPGYAFVTAAGNEANTRRHTQGAIPGTGDTDNIRIRVGRQGVSFTVMIFGPAYDKLSVGVTSPTGEVLPRVPFRSGTSTSTDLVLEDSIVHLRYYRDVNNNVIVGFERATEGVWEITLFGDMIVSGEYWAWLPISGQVSEEVEFLRPVPEYTIVYPATAMRTITCGAYNPVDGSLFSASSWGPTRIPRMSPDFVAPGVNIRGVYPTGAGTMTGTSAAAAVTAGAAALMMDWGVVQNNMPSINGDLIRSLFIAGCRRNGGMTYPNVRWGFGQLDLYGTFIALRETNIG